MRLLRVGNGERPGGLGVRVRAAAAALLASALACTAGTAWAARTVRGQHEQAAADRAFTALQDVSARLPGPPGPEYPGFAYALVAPDGQWVRSANLADPRAFDPVVQLPPIAPQPLGPGAPGLFAPDTVTVSYPAGSAPDPRLARAGQQPYRFLRSLTGGQLTVYVLVDPLPAERAGDRITRLLGWGATPVLSLLAAGLAWAVAGPTLRRRAAGPGSATAPPVAADPPAEPGLLPPERTVELHDLVAAQLAERARSAPGLAFTGELAPVTVRGREVLLARVVRSLLDDAARHARSGVTASLRRAGGLAVLTVAADGPGQPADDAPPAAGLALVRTTVHALGGTASAGGPGWAPGARLVVRLPAVSRPDRP